MADIVKVDYWAKRWEEGDSFWHKNFIQPCLEQHYQKLIPLQEQPAKTRIFLPLCGKSLDMLWLADKGFQVVGLEAVESAVKDFFKENSITFEVKTSPGTPEIKYYFGVDRDITIYVMDLFDVTVERLGGPFDAIWDRGSMSAIGVYAENRGKKYADLMVSLLHPHGRIMIENHVYSEDPGPHRGPPSHVPPELMKELFGDKIDIVPLTVKNSVSESKPFKRVYYLMSFKMKN